MTAPTTAFAFPGQGSQHVGMGQHLIARFPKETEPFLQADDVSGLPLLDLLRNGPDEVLRRTEFAQPATFLVSVMTEAVLRAHGVAAMTVMGHSVGEYAALVAAGALSWQDGLRLVSRRGELMALASQQAPGGMTAVLGLAIEIIEQLCQPDPGSQEPRAYVANINAADQVVLAGDLTRLREIAASALEQGAREVIQLRVSAPFHCPLMSSALPGLVSALADIDIRQPSLPVISSVSGGLVSEPEAIRTLLGRQLVEPVRWTASLAELLTVAPPDLMIEVGPGRALTGLARRVLPRSSCLHTSDAANLRRACRRPSERALTECCET